MIFQNCLQITNHATCYMLHASCYMLYNHYKSCYYLYWYKGFNERCTSSGSEGFFTFNMPWRCQICIAKCLYSYITCIEEAFEFCCRLFAEELSKLNDNRPGETPTRTNLRLEPMTTKIIMSPLIYLISMEFLGTEWSDDAMAAKTSLKNCMYVLPVFIAIIPVHVLHQK